VALLDPPVHGVTPAVREMGGLYGHEIRIR
jgi:hypothetical protein